MGRSWLIGVAAVGIVACKPAGREQGAGLVPPADAPAMPTEPAAAPTAAPAEVSAAAIQPQDLLSGPLDLSGAEPSWTLKIRRDTLALDRPDKTQVLAVNPGPRLDGAVAVWEGMSAASGAVLRIRVLPGRCSDGVSSRAYPMTAVVGYEGHTFKGCAAPAGATAAERNASAPARPSPPRNPGGASPPQG